MTTKINLSELMRDIKIHCCNDKITLNEFIAEYYRLLTPYRACELMHLLADAIEALEKVAGEFERHVKIRNERCDKGDFDSAKDSQAYMQACLPIKTIAEYTLAKIKERVEI